MIGGPWTVDANFKSSVYLKSVVETLPVNVTPILYLSNGRRYTLPDVLIEPSGTAVLDINQALGQQGLAPWATLGGYVEVQYTWPWDPICGTIRNVDTLHSLIFTHFMRPPKPFTSKGKSSKQNPAPANAASILEGTWWKQENNVTGFVSLSNVYSWPITASVQLSDDRGRGFAQYSVTISPHGSKRIDLKELRDARSSQGGIRVTYSGIAGDDPITSGALEDPATGYSATLHFGPAPPTSATQKQISFAALGLMVGAADPMMSFPSETRFTPYTVLRNVSDAPVSVRPTLWWMQGGGPRSAQLSQLILAPYQTQTLDVMALISDAGLKNFNGSLNLILDAYGKSAALLTAAGSVDQTGTYVFEVTPHGVVESASKSLSYWSTGDGDDTMVTLWNPSDESQDFIFKLTFSGGHYSLPIHMEPRVTRAFNISEIIQNQIADAEGNIIPVAIHSGSAKIAGSQADNEIILVAMDAGTYNVRKATCGSYCITCDGAEGFWVLASSFAIPVGGQQQQALWDFWDTGKQYNLTNSSTWSSTHTNIATVQTGLVHGVAAGSITISATDSSEILYYSACGSYQLYCPQEMGGGAGGPGTVQVPTSLPVVLTTTNQATTGCNAGQAGWTRVVNRQLSDQTGAPIRRSGDVITENVALGANGLLLPPPTTGSPTTNADGQVADYLSFCSTQCPSSKTTTQTQTINDGTYPLGTYTLVFSCTGITVNGN